MLPRPSPISQWFSQKSLPITARIGGPAHHPRDYASDLYSLSPISGSLYSQSTIQGVIYPTEELIIPSRELLPVPQLPHPWNAMTWTFTGFQPITAWHTLVWKDNTAFTYSEQWQLFFGENTNSHALKPKQCKHSTHSTQGRKVWILINDCLLFIMKRWILMISCR